MLAPNLSAVTLELLRSACAERWSESGTLEFKREPPGMADKDKHELLKDVSALANFDGGDLVFGIEEKDGVAHALAPIRSELADALERRLVQVLDAGLEPRVQGLRWHRVELENGGYVLVLRVPASFQGPHSIKVNHSRRFVMRNGTTTSDFTFDQLRMAFDRTASLVDQARAFINARTAALTKGKGAKPLVDGPIRALHFVPLVGLAGREAPDLNRLYGDNALLGRLHENGWGGGSRMFNLDGLVAFPGGDGEDGFDGYVQAFRNGSFEAAALGGGFRQMHPQMPEQLVVYSLDMTQWFRERSQTVLAVAKELGMSGPAVVSFSMLNVANAELSTDTMFSSRRPPTPDREHLAAPEVWIENLETASADEFVRPLLDTLWQGFGRPRCLDYDATTGEYKPRSR